MPHIHFNRDYCFHSITELENRPWRAYFKKSGNVQSEDVCTIKVTQDTNLLAKLLHNTTYSGTEHPYKILIQISDGNHSKDFDCIDIFDIELNQCFVSLPLMYNQYLKGHGVIQTEIPITIYKN